MSPMSFYINFIIWGVFYIDFVNSSMLARSPPVCGPVAHRSWALYLLSLWNISDAGNINIPLPLATLARSDHIAKRRLVFRAALFIRLAALFSVCSCKGFLTILHYKVHIRHQRFSRFNHINRKKCYNNGGGG